MSLPSVPTDAFKAVIYAIGDEVYYLGEDSES